MFMKGLERRRTQHRTGAKVDRVRFQWTWWLSTLVGEGVKFCKIAQESASGQSLSLKQNWKFTTDLLSLLLLFLLPDNSVCSLKIIITETCSRQELWSGELYDVMAEAVFFHLRLQHSTRPIVGAQGMLVN